MSDRACEHCGGPVTAVNRRTRFCGLSCSAKARPRRLGAANPNWRGGKTQHSLYETYLQMVARCVDANHPRWDSYGGRGITVCERWRADFWNFVADMGERPEGCSLDRVDNDGPYAPENCRWATASEQNQNRRKATHCHAGHPYTEKTRTAKNGKRLCTPCSTRYTMEYRARKAQQ